MQLRPVYETKNDLENEKGIAKLVSEELDCTLVKLPRKYQLDYGIVTVGEGGKKFITGMVEIKCRNIPKNKYDTYMISADKFMVGLQYMQQFNLTIKLVVSWTDGVGLYYFKKDDSYHIGFSGRYDRGDSEDVEPVVYIPIKAFKTL